MRVCVQRVFSINLGIIMAFVASVFSVLHDYCVGM